MIKNFQWCVYTYQHRRAFTYVVNRRITDPLLREEMLARAKVHDMDKMLLYLFWDQYTSQKYHVNHTAHHLESGIKQSYLDMVETVIDYECAPYTKPDKPLNAYAFTCKLVEDRYLDPEKAAPLFAIMKDLGIDSPDTVRLDLEGRERMQSLETVTEEEILLEVFRYVRENPDSLKPLEQEGIDLPQNKEEDFTTGIEKRILPKVQSLPGKIGIYYEDLTTGAVWSYHGDTPMVAASMIKLYVMVEAFHQIEEGEILPEQKVTIRQEDQVPGCGAVGYMEPGMEVSVKDLITLMIILSDNTATNCLIDLLGMSRINEGIESMGDRVTALNRKLFDEEKSAQGIENQICAREVGQLLSRLYHGTAGKGSEEMCSLLKQQQINHKIPFYLQQLPCGPEIAHKTGEDDGITHDGAIIYGKHPFVLVCCGDETDVPAYERAIQDVAKEVYEWNLEGGVTKI